MLLNRAAEVEAKKSDDLDFGLNIVAIGKAGVGKSATINSIFGEDKTSINAFQSATGSVKEISGVVGGVPIRVFDTPGLKSSIMEKGNDKSVLASAKKFTKKNPTDIVLYVDYLDAHTRDHNDFPLSFFQKILGKGKKVKLEQKVALKEYKVHSYGICVVGFMDDHYPVRSAYSVLNQVIDEYQKKHDDSWKIVQVDKTGQWAYLIDALARFHN
ncbi:translocase of chloroplast 159, chloroplastic [Tanacetum coccineum]